MEEDGGTGRRILKFSCIVSGGQGINKLWVCTGCLPSACRCRSCRQAEFLCKLYSCLSSHINPWFPYAISDWRSRRKWLSSLGQKPQMKWRRGIFLRDRKTFWYKPDSSGEQQRLKAMVCKISCKRCPRLATRVQKSACSLTEAGQL